MNRTVIACALAILAAPGTPLSAGSRAPEIAVEIVAPPAHPGYRPVLSETQLREEVVPLLGPVCDEAAIARTLERRFRFLGYVPSLQVSCGAGGVRLRLRESSHTVDLITFDASDLERLGVRPAPEFEERRRLYPLAADAPRAVLRGLLLTREGDLYNFERYRADSEALQKMGYAVAFIPGEAREGSAYPSGAYLIQSLTPRAAGTGTPRRTNYLGGTGSYGPRQKSALGLLYEKDELFGRLDRLSVSPTYNAAAGGTLAYTAPLLAARQEPRRLYDLDLRLFSSYRHNRLLEGVLTDERQTGFSATLGVRPLRLEAPHSLRLLIGLRRERVALLETPPGETEGDTDTVQLGATYEWRHTYRWPSLSARLSPGVDFVARAGGGERTFVRGALEASLHGRLPSGVEAYLHFTGGTLDRQVPSFELWSLGGAATVRGFREDSFLGRHMAALQAEIWVPFVRPLQAAEPKAARLFKWAVFADGGYLSGTTAGTTESIAGAGVGIRFIVPRHPLVIRLDYGWGLGVRGGDAFPYVTLGYRY